jgi:hypothetical protein
MMRNMLRGRMKVAGHIVEQERTTLALVVARNDGRLGPQLRKSTIDCNPVRWRRRLLLWPWRWVGHATLLRRATQPRANSPVNPLAHGNLGGPMIR